MEAHNVEHLFSLLHLIANISKTLFFIAYLIVFSILVAVDAAKAFKKRAHWIPGKALVLSALTIQALAFLDSRTVTTQDRKEPELEEFKFLLHYQLIVDGGRLSLCVFIGYLLPGMVGSRSANNLKMVAALVLSLFTQIISELFFIHENKSEFKKYSKKERHETYVFRYVLSSNVLLASIAFLISISVCAVVAGTTVRGILTQRIAGFFATYNEIEACQNIPYPCIEDPECHKIADEGWRKTSWHGFQDEVFKSWILARLSQPDYVMTRSVLGSMSGLVVNICVVFCVVKTVLITRHNNNHFYNHFRIYSSSLLSYVWLEVCAICSFVMVGWVVICWRWLTALFYFPKFKLLRGKTSVSERMRTLFFVENFWTNSVVEVISVVDIKGSHLGPKSRGHDIPSLLVKIVAKIRLHKLLYVLCRFQILIILLSKACQVLSEIVLTQFMFMINWMLSRLSIIPNHGEQKVSARYEEFAEILERVCMPGEDPACLWRANLSSINQIELCINEGIEKGRQCDIINSHSDRLSLQWIEEGVGLMHKLRREALPRVNKYFPDLDHSCWKMTAISLLRLIIELDDNLSDRVKSCVKACHEAWDILDFVDNAYIGSYVLNLNLMGDTAASSTNQAQLSAAADREFYTLQAFYQQLPASSKAKAECQEISSLNVDTSSQCECVKKMSTEAASLLKAHKLLEDETGTETRAKGNRKAYVDFKLHDSIDWMKIAPHYSMYRLCKLILDEVDTEADMDCSVWAEHSLRNIIACSLLKLPDTLVQYSRQCAQNFEEDNLWKANYLAGKTKGLIEKLGMQEVEAIQQQIETKVERTIKIT